MFEVMYSRNCVTIMHFIQERLLTNLAFSSVLLSEYFDQHSSATKF